MLSAVRDSVEDMVSRGRSGAAVALDEAQRAVVELRSDASGVVVGAPGTGKTETLVARVAALVERGVDPDAILVLTPSRQTATALRDRLALAIGRATSGPAARSVASFAFQLVRAASVAAGAEPPQLLTGGDEDQLIQDLLDGDAEDELAGRRRWPEWLGPAIRGTKGFRTEVRTFLAECTTLGIEPEALRALGERHGLDADTPPWIQYLRQYADIPLRNDINKREDYMTIAKWALNEAWMNMDLESCKEIMDLLEAACVSVVNQVKQS